MPLLIDGTPHEDGIFTLQLTSGAPHRLKTSLGQGSLSLGPEKLLKTADLRLPVDACVLWHCFDPFATPAGSPWPRSFYYTGNDHGFFTWSQLRPIENFSWYPQLQQDVHIDASQSQIRELSIHLQAGHQGHIHLKLPQQGMHLHLQGNLEQITVTAGLPESLSLSPATSKNPADKAFQLPDMGCLKQVGTLELRNGAGRQAVSLQNLLQFSKLDSLSLWGNHSDLAQLSSCTQLRALSLRFMRHLSELPALQAWPQLDSFIAYNVEEAAGKRLRQQLKERTRARPWAGYISVSQLRKPEWWTKEYGRPFAGWPAARARIAHAAYDLAEQEIGTASSLDHVQAALTTFTARFNTVKGIETSEREDLGLAVQQLAQLPAALALKLTHEQAGQWFDENRDY
ncbi:hypothetical protein DJFAAGMI_03685 [Comamonas sp. PE63]|uniref:Transcriptional regulator n=1 Tax=Comamonas brasiliensis TaxID=1812482 RepID=A0ABS5LX98_9BURK|nr:transcriptional regulator [Comamonas sp. PE63]MBS3020921.1 hypothetical protein [Comamonas sp. PE63]